MGENVAKKAPKGSEHFLVASDTRQAGLEGSYRQRAGKGKVELRRCSGWRSLAPVIDVGTVSTSWLVIWGVIGTVRPFTSHWVCGPFPHGSTWSPALTFVLISLFHCGFSGLFFLVFLPALWAPCSSR